MKSFLAFQVAHEMAITHDLSCPSIKENFGCPPSTLYDAIVLDIMGEKTNWWAKPGSSSMVTMK